MYFSINHWTAQHFHSDRHLFIDKSGNTQLLRGRRKSCCMELFNHVNASSGWSTTYPSTRRRRRELTIKPSGVAAGGMVNDS